MEFPPGRNAVKVAGLLKSRSRAFELGDRNLARSITADLARLGWVDDDHPPEPVWETTEAPGMPEMAVPDAPVRRGPGRPRKPRPVEVP